jgi:hypothetical protein
MAMENLTIAFDWIFFGMPQFVEVVIRLGFIGLNL